MIMTLKQAIKEFERRKQCNELSIEYSGKNPEEQERYKIQAVVWKRAIEILNEVEQ